MDDSDNTPEMVWQISGPDCVYGYFIWSRGRRFRYDMTPNVGAVLKLMIDKITDVPEEFLETVLRDFFSIYLTRNSGGAVRGELLPHVWPPANDHHIQPTECAAVSSGDQFLYLRRFNGRLPTAGLAAEICSPGEVTIIAAIGLSFLSRCIQWCEWRLSRRLLATASLISIDSESWLREVSRLSKSMRAVIIDVNLYERRSSGHSISGLHAEMALSMIIEPTVARAYFKRPNQPLPPWLPPQLAVDVKPSDLVVAPRRQALIAHVRGILHPDIQSKFAKHFENCRAVLKRSRVLDEAPADVARI